MIVQRTSKLPTIIHYYKDDELQRFKTARSYIRFYIAFYTLKAKQTALNAFWDTIDTLQGQNKAELI